MTSQSIGAAVSVNVTPSGWLGRHCSDCKWWYKPDSQFALPFYGEDHLCEKVQDASPIPGETVSRSLHPDTKAHALKALFTAPDFGCVQWEPKENT